MNKNITLIFLLFAITAGLAGCSSNDNKVDFIPFKSDEDGKWGMISTDGKVLFEKEFHNVPTYVTEGRFFVQNQEGFWEMYSAEENPERIGGELRFASPFSNGVAMVTPRNEPITIINKKGEPVATLEEFENKKVTWASRFVGSTAVVACDTLLGVVDTKGNTVVPPKFATIEQLPSGLMIAAKYNYASSHFTYDSLPKGSQYILDSKGNEIFELPASKYWGVEPKGVTDKYITVVKRKMISKTQSTGKDSYTYKEPEFTYSIIDYKGNEIVAASKNVKQILAVRGETYIFSNEDNLCGVKTFDGQTIIKPEYDGINFINEDCYAVQKTTEETDENYNFVIQMKLLDKEGNKIGNNTFRAVAGNCNYRSLSGKAIYVEDDDNEWTAYNTKGEKIDDLPEIYQLLPYSFGDERMQTDKVNFSKFIKGLRITPTSMGNYNFSMGPREALSENTKEWNTIYNPTEKPKASDYSHMSSLYTSQTVDGLYYSAEIKFPTTLSKQTYSQKRVIDYVYGSTYWYHLENIPTGYVFNNITPSAFEMTFSAWSFYGKLRPLYKALIKYCKKWGNVEESNPGATYMSLFGGGNLLIALKDNEVIMKWGKLPSDDRWIGMYASNSEKLESTYAGNLELINMINNYYSSSICEEEGD